MQRGDDRGDDGFEVGARDAGDDAGGALNGAGVDLGRRRRGRRGAEGAVADQLATGDRELGGLGVELFALGGGEVDLDLSPLDRGTSGAWWRTTRRG